MKYCLRSKSHFNIISTVSSKIRLCQTVPSIVVTARQGAVQAGSPLLDGVGQQLALLFEHLATALAPPADIR